MSETRIRNLNLFVTDLKAISALQLESTRNQEFFVSINFKNMISLKFLDDTVLVIQFENGELRMDLSRGDLEGIYDYHQSEDEKDETNERDII